MASERASEQGWHRCALLNDWDSQARENAKVTCNVRVHDVVLVRYDKVCLEKPPQARYGECAEETRQVVMLHTEEQEQVYVWHGISK